MNKQEKNIEFSLEYNVTSLDDSLKLNAYFVTFLTLSGIILNLISITVFVYAKGRNPIIGGIKYLFILRYIFLSHSYSALLIGLIN